MITNGLLTCSREYRGTLTPEQRERERQRARRIYESYTRRGSGSS